MSKYYWTTIDGRKLDVDDLDVTHLRNILKMIIRNNSKPKVENPKFEINGEIARQFIEDQIEAEYFDETFDYYENHLL